MLILLKQTHRLVVTLLAVLHLVVMDVIVVVVAVVVAVVTEVGVEEMVGVAPVTVVVLAVAKTAVSPAVRVLNNMYKKVFIFFAILLVVLVLTKSYDVISEYRSDVESTHRSQLLNEAQNLLDGGDYKQAADQVRDLVSQGGSDRETVRARVLMEVGDFMSGTKDDRLAAIRSNKESYQALEGDEYTQALLINKLLGSMNIAAEQYVFDEVFEGQPFGQLLVTGDRMSSIRNLAELSVSLFPTTEATFAIAWWHTDRISNLYGNWGLSPQEKQQHVAEILRLIAQADNLLSFELDAVGDRPFDYMIEPRFYFWKASLYQVLARSDKAYLANATDSLASFDEAYGRTVFDENGNSRALVQTLFPYAHFYFAQALYEVEGESSLMKVEEHINITLDEVEAHPNIHQGAFVAFFRNIAPGSPEALQKYYWTYVGLANRVPRFKTFLIRQGWPFDQ